MLRRPAGERGDRWDTRTELLAQIVEVTSVAAAQQRLKEPIKLPRPDTGRRDVRAAAAARAGATAAAAAPDTPPDPGGPPAPRSPAVAQLEATAGRVRLVRSVA